METEFKCVGCGAKIDPEKELLCPVCTKAHPVAVNIWKVLRDERAIPDPCTYWEWDNFLPRVLWGLALKIEADLNNKKWLRL